MITSEQIAAAKLKRNKSNAVHEHDDCVRMAYEWLDAQAFTRTIRKHYRPLKHLIERWAGRYVSQDDVEIAAMLHPKVRGDYPNFNISSRLVEPSVKRLEKIGESLKHSYRDRHNQEEYSRRENTPA